MDIEICDRCGISFPYSNGLRRKTILPFELCGECTDDPKPVFKAGYPNERYCRGINMISSAPTPILRPEDYMNG